MWEERHNNMFFLCLGCIYPFLIGMRGSAGKTRRETFMVRKESSFGVLSSRLSNLFISALP
jgi:hypothetical protein